METFDFLLIFMNMSPKQEIETLKLLSVSFFFFRKSLFFAVVVQKRMKKRKLLCIVKNVKRIFAKSVTKPI